MNEIIKQESSSVSQNIYKPSEIIGIFNSVLARQSVNAQIVYLRGIYLANQKQGNWAYCYDSLRDEDSQEELTLRLTQQLRENLKNGNLVSVGGVLNRNISSKGFIQIVLNVSRIEIVKEQAISEDEIKQSELRQKKSSIGFKNVDTIIENLLLSDRRPKIALIFAETSITMGDFEAGINAARTAIDFEEYRVSFSNSAELVTQLKKVDKLQYDIIAIVRGGGGGIEKLDDLKVLAAIIELKTPIIGAIGHVEEKLFIKQLVDKCAPTPNGLGQYFSEMVESANEKKTHSRAILTEQIKKQFKEQIDAGHKQNKELQEKLRVLTENQKKATEAQEIATKKHNEQVEAANKLNKELQDKLRVLTENQKKADEEQQIANKKHIEQIEAAQKQNQSLQEQLKTLNESQKKLQIIHQKQQEDLGKNLTKMQDANTLLQKSLEKATMQNAETLKELNHAKEQAKELEHSMSELKSKKGTNIWMWIAISAILILLCMLVL